MLEGFFIQLPTNLEDEAHVVGNRDALAEEGKHVSLAVMAVAKEHSHRLRKMTSNKVWPAKWTRRMTDMVAGFRKQLDSNAIVVAFTKLFLVEWDTPMPRARGVCFEDVYLDGSWCVAEKPPEHDC